MTNRLKMYSRLDAQNNRIQGTSVLRKKMPRTGKWVEDEPVNLCCFPFFELTATPSDVTDDSFTLTIQCDGSDIVVLNMVADAATTDIEGLVALLNDKASYVGIFSASESDIILKLKQEVAGDCDEVDLSFTVEPTA